MTLLDKAKSGMSSLERSISGLPVIRDYREKELRRAADRKIRQSMARRLEGYRRKLTGLQRDLVATGQLRSLPDLERAVGRLQLLIDRIKTAASGYAGFFDADKVREEELERIIEFDSAISQKVPEINDAIRALNEAAQSGEGYQEALDDLLAKLAELHEQFDERQAVINAATE